MQTVSLRYVSARAPTIRRNQKSKLNQPVSLSVTTDSLSAFDVLVTFSAANGRMLMVSVQIVIGSYHNIYINNVAYIRSKHYVAEASAKVQSHAASQNNNQWRNRASH